MVRDPDVRAALCYMRENIGQPIQAREIACATTLSHRTLNSRFYGECGSSIVRQLTKARITYILSPSRETSLSISRYRQNVRLLIPIAILPATSERRWNRRRTNFAGSIPHLK